MKSKEIFNSLRVTTMEVAGPLINLASHRGRMIKRFLEFIQDTSDIDDPAVAKIINDYNDYALRDQALVNVAQGKASEELT